MDQYKPPNGVTTRAQAAANELTELQMRNMDVYLEADVLKVKFKSFWQEP